MRTVNPIVLIFQILFLPAICGGYTNVRLDAKTRTYLKHMEKFVQDIDPEARPFSPVLSNKQLRGYGLKSRKMVCLYIVSVKDSTYRTIMHGATVTVDGIISKGKGYWYSPLTGDTISVFSVSRGSQKLIIPDFREDIAVKIKMQVNTDAVDFKCKNSNDYICLYYTHKTPPFAAADRGEVVYFDRNYAVTSASTDLKGMTILPNMCAKKTVPVDSIYWRFSLSKKCDVYVGFSNRYKKEKDPKKLKWLKGWQKVKVGSLSWKGGRNGNTYSDTHSAWFKKKGNRFDLRGQNGGAANYIVLVDAVVKMESGAKQIKAKK